MEPPVERNKKFGTIAIAVSIVLAIASVVLSENLCYAGSPAAESWLNLLLVCLRVNVYEEIPGNQFADHIYLPTKYLLLACATLLAVGVLWYTSALPAPGKSGKAESQEPPDGQARQ